MFCVGFLCDVFGLCGLIGFLGKICYVCVLCFSCFFCCLFIVISCVIEWLCGLFSVFVWFFF